MRRSMLLVGVVAVCVAAGLAVSISSAGDPAGPVTLAQWSGYGSVGQDADSVVWCRQASSSPHQSVIHIQRSAGSSERRVSAPCGLILVADASVAWGTFEGGGACDWQEVVYALVGGRARRVAETTTGCSGVGDLRRGLVGDGTALFYSVIRIVGSPVGNCEGGVEPCSVRVGGGHVYRIVGGRGIAVPAVPPAAVIAASDGRISTVRPTTIKVGRMDSPDVTRAARNGVVEVRRSGNGAVIARFRPTGIVREMALSQHYAVVLVENKKTVRIAWYDAMSGSRLGTVPVAPTTSQLSASGNLAVFSDGNVIRLLDLQTGKTRDLWRANSDPYGLSVSGKRVVWSESSDSNKTTKALALTLP